MSQQPTQEWLEAIYKYVDENGRRYMLDNLDAPTPTPENAYEYKGYVSPPNGRRRTREQMEQLDAEGRLYFGKTKIRRKCFMDERI